MFSDMKTRKNFNKLSNTGTLHSIAGFLVRGQTNLFQMPQHGEHVVGISLLLAVCGI